MKECSGDVRRIPAIIAAAPDLEVLVGGDDWALEGLAAGATGWVTGVADVVPAECVELYERCRAGELDRARAIYQRMLPLARFDMTPKLVQYFKGGDGRGRPRRRRGAPAAARSSRAAERDDLAAALRALQARVGA